MELKIADDNDWRINTEKKEMKEDNGRMKELDLEVEEWLKEGN